MANPTYIRLFDQYLIKIITKNLVLNLKLCPKLSGTITMLWVPLITQTEARNHIL